MTCWIIYTYRQWKERKQPQI